MCASRGFDVGVDRSPCPPGEAGIIVDAIAATRRWIERSVIGLNLCPFARAPLVGDRVRIQTSTARDIATLTLDLRSELQHLQAADPTTCETTLLVHPYVLEDFLDFNDFLDVGDALLRELDLEGEIQIASFHPDYRFADSAADSVENCSNRSPYPTLHLLRESSVDAAVTSSIDTAAIPKRNIETLRELGMEGWHALCGKPKD